MHQVRAEPAGEVLLSHGARGGLQRAPGVPPLREPRPRADRHGERERADRAAHRRRRRAADRRARGEARRGAQRRLRRLQGDRAAVLNADGKYYNVDMENNYEI